MARRRVFRTRVKCPGISTNLGLTANRVAMVGRSVTLEKSASNSEVSLCLDGDVVGRLDATVGSRVASAIERGQSFTAVVENAYPIYDDKFKATGAQIDIKVEYLLEKGQPAIETEQYWRCVESSHEASQTTRSFFAKVAGVTFEERQRIAARCSERERLILVRDPGNRFDKGAIKVMRLNGEQLGFIPAHVSRGGDSSGLASQMDEGVEYQCRIGSITGGGPGRSIGVNIEITEGRKFDDAALVDGSKPARTTLGERTLRQVLLWIFALVVIGCILWAAFQYGGIR